MAEEWGRTKNCFKNELNVPFSFKLEIIIFFNVEMQMKIANERTQCNGVNI